MHDVVDPALLSRLHHAHITWLHEHTVKAMEMHGVDTLVIHAGSLVRRSTFDDQDWPLRVTPHFAHWAPLQEPDCAILVRAGHKPILIHVVSSSYWESPPPRESEHFWDAFHVIEVSSVDDAKGVILNHGTGHRAIVAEASEAGRTRAHAWGFDVDSTSPPGLVRALDALRTQKTAYEIVCLREANRRTGLGHDAVKAAFAGGVHSELELHLAYLRATAQDDSETPYKNIVAFDGHAATLHHVSYAKHAHPASSMLLDAGVTYLGYASDVTRTFIKGGGAGASAFAALVDGVEKMQRALCAQVAVGMKYEALHNDAHVRLAQVLRDVGVAKGSDGELVDGGVTRKLLPHGLGHSLGLQTHDVGCALMKPEPRNPFLRNTSVIAAGQVFTIEPGCYFIPALLDELRAGPMAHTLDWQLVDMLVPFGGVRIEDDLVVTANGVDNLTRAFLP